MEPVTPVSTALRYDSINLHPQLVHNLHKNGFYNLFEIQALVIPKLILNNRIQKVIKPKHILASAPTGCGKTLAYVIPILQSLYHKSNWEERRLKALIILPTKELAIQVYEVFSMLSSSSSSSSLPSSSSSSSSSSPSSTIDISVALICGQHSFAKEQLMLVGKTTSTSALSTTMALRDQEQRLRDGALHSNEDLLTSTSSTTSLGHSLVDVVICTPGRLQEHLTTTSTAGFTLMHLEYLVLDEADRLLSNAYHHWVKQLIAATTVTESNQNKQLGKKAECRWKPLMSSTNNNLSDKCVTHKSTCLSPVYLIHNRAHLQHQSKNLQQQHQHPHLQRLLFSATLTDNPAKLNLLGIKNPLVIKVGGDRSQKSGSDEINDMENLDSGEEKDEIEFVESEKDDGNSDKNDDDEEEDMLSEHDEDSSTTNEHRASFETVGGENWNIEASMGVEEPKEESNLAKFKQNQLLLQQQQQEKQRSQQTTELHQQFFLPPLLTESIVVVDTSRRPLALAALLLQMCFPVVYEQQQQQQQQQLSGIKDRVFQLKDKIFMNVDALCVADLTESKPEKMILVFTSSVATTHKLCTLLQLMNNQVVDSSESGECSGNNNANVNRGNFTFGGSVHCISRDVNIVARKNIIASCKAGLVRVLVATDQMARGINISNIAVVVNYDCPSDVTTYLHRIGRTARGASASTSSTSATSPLRMDGAEGHALTMIKTGQLNVFKQLHQHVHPSARHKQLIQSMNKQSRGADVVGSSFFIEKDNVFRTKVNKEAELRLQQRYERALKLLPLVINDHSKRYVVL